MPESASTIYRRKLRQVDNSIYNAICDLFPYYCVLMRSDPILGAACEQLILEWESAREIIHTVYVCAWETDHAQFQTIGEASKLIQEAHTTITRKEQQCLAYSKLWDRLAAASLTLLEKRGKASGKPSGWPDLPPQA